MVRQLRGHLYVVTCSTIYGRRQLCEDGKPNTSVCLRLELSISKNKCVKCEKGPVVYQVSTFTPASVCQHDIIAEAFHLTTHNTYEWILAV